MDTSHYRRFHDYDYSRGASLFITISTEPRRPCFGAVVNAQLVHSPLGKAVCEALESFPIIHPGFTLHGYVVMPDHVHFNLRIEPGMADPLKRLGLAIRGFKRYTAALALTLEQGADPRDEAIARQDAPVRGRARQDGAPSSSCAMAHRADLVIARQDAPSCCAMAHRADWGHREAGWRGAGLREAGWRAPSCYAMAHRAGCAKVLS